MNEKKFYHLPGFIRGFLCGIGFTLVMVAVVWAFRNIAADDVIRFLYR